MGAFLGLLFDMLLWGSAAILVGAFYLAYYSLKAFVKLLQKLLNNLGEN